MSSRSEPLLAAEPSPRRSTGGERYAPAVLIFSAYFVAASVATVWARVTGAASPIWPAAGIGIAGLALAGPRYWPAIALAALAAMQVTQSAHGPVIQLLLALGKCVGSVAGAMILRRSWAAGQGPLQRLPNIAWLLAAGAVAALITAGSGTALYLAEDTVGWRGAANLFITWLLSDSVGTFIFGSLVLAWLGARGEERTTADCLRLAAILGATGAVAWLAFVEGIGPPTFYLYPVLIWAAFDQRSIGASSSLTIAALIAIGATTEGLGPFVRGGSSIANLITLQQYLAVSSLMTLILAAVSEERTLQARSETATARSLAANRLAELNSLYDSAPIGLGFFDRDYRYIRINDQLAAINGVPAEEHIGRTIREVLPVNAPAVEPVIDRVFATGEAVGDYEVTGETPSQPGVTRHWITGFYPVKNVNGGVDAVGAWVIEISERKRAEEREWLLAREVDHRAKNLLAVVQSIVQLTKATEPTEFKGSIVGRIQSLARAHSLLADSRWDGAQLGILIREELAPYIAADRSRVVIDGPDLLLGPAAAQSLAMILHELATNAAKYGALSDAAGRLSVSWRLTNDIIELVWDERDGPRTARPTASGFGTRIVQTTVERQLRGSVSQEWRTEGLHCTIRIPAANAMRTNAGRNLSDQLASGLNAV